MKHTVEADRAGEDQGRAIEPRRTPRVLSIAGTDPTGGAGQHADLKTVAVLGGYGMSAITAIVVQNTQGVEAVHPVPVSVLSEQLEAVSRDVTVDAVKIGMLGSVPVIEAVSQWLGDHRPPVVVLDPVMVATAGGRLLDDDAEDAIRKLLELADLVTPNLPELAVLLGEEVAADWATALDQGHRLAEAHRVRVLVKGGHLPGEDTPDALIEPGRPEPAVEVHAPRVETRNTHGTGCSLSSAVAVLAARTGEWPAAVRAGRQWLRGALLAADRLEVGHGNGPVHHGHHLDDLLEQAVAEWSRPETEDEAEDTGTSFTRQLWNESGDLRERIRGGSFVPGLADGSLPREVFLDYLAQDLIYLQDYSRALAQLAVRAPRESWRALFAAGSAGCAEETATLHKTLVEADAPVQSTEVTDEYTDFLLATTQSRDWAVGVAAVLPCYWLYAWIGTELDRQRRAAQVQDGHDGSGGAHPYAAWLDSYSDPAFAEAGERVRAVVDDLARTADPATVDHMRRAFHRACELEFRFFEDPCLRGRARNGSGDGRET
ncbi:bifunctional hydroxymethylpyrimidine kinase/phosphomethylpyrimidine kinase [Kocuria coralli]|uniref:bifunctional hydroxymethylpyrimidine kinase/phosphomethylpyrimidine kinase n=1 Tax=Kocuria coralli TaxID=1461025 RepID=UPI001FEAFE45|nr:bifunctional hydroxymethylpyrimidine kinase/phosphomethylpyrimidine kinase [Kocuria coralli]